MQDSVTQISADKEPFSQKTLP